MIVKRVLFFGDLVAFLDFYDIIYIIWQKI